MYELLKQKCFWPSMKSDCAKYSSSCFECQLTRGKAHGSWQGQLLPLPPGPRCEWSLDLIVNLGDGTNTVHVLSAICCFSKFCILTLIDDKSSTTVANAVREKIFQLFGNPSRVRTDNGTEFRGAFDALCAAHNVKHVRSSPYTSHSNGQVERLHRTVEDLTKRCLVTLPASAYRTVLREI
jgi:transposase InsO family protein